MIYHDFINGQEKELRVRSEQFSILATPTIPMAISHIIAAAIILLQVERGEGASSSVLLACFVCILTVSIWRIILYLTYKRRDVSLGDASVWERRFLIPTIILACVWSFSSIFIFHYVDEKHQYIMLLTIVGIGSLGALSFSALRSFFYTFISITIMPTSILFLMKGSHDSTALGLLTFMFAIGLIIGSQRNYRSIEQNITLRFDGIERERKLKRFRLALDSAVDSVYIIDPDYLRFVDVNETAHTSLGFSKAELLSMGPQDIEPFMAKDELANIFEELLSSEDKVRKVETIHEHKDGRRTPVEIFFHAVNKDAVGKMVIASVRDVSERKAYEKRLSKLSKGLESSAEAIFITDERGIIEYVNPAFTHITGYSYDEATGEKPSLLKSDAQDSKVYQKIWKTITAGMVWSGPLVERRKNGEFYHALVSIAPIFDEHDEIINYVSNHRDISEQKSLEEQLQHAQKMEAVGTLVGGISHDFNNMLAAIIGNAYLAKISIVNNDKLEGYVDAINTISMRATEMIKQLLSFSRKGEIVFQEFSFNKFMEEGYSFARKTMPANIEHVCLSCSQDLIVDGDPNILQQALINMLNNARDAVNDVPQPKITCTLNSITACESFKERHLGLDALEYAKMTIADNGSGISKERVDKIFDPFFTTKEVGKGTGLGLSMAFGAIRSHGGVIEVESELGKGTSFHIYIPLIENAQVIDSEVEESITCGNGEMVLLVDDNEDVRTSSCDILESLGYKTLVAEDGLEALDLHNANKDQIDLILTDIVMPKMGGLDLALSLQEQGASTPIIFMTGYNEILPSSASNDLKKIPLINKPFSIGSLSQIIRESIPS